MKFKNIKNIFTPEIKEFELSEKEINYLAMISAGVDKRKVMELLPINYGAIRKIYSALGLTDKTKKRDVQAATLMASNNLIKDNVFLDLYRKFNLIECMEMVDIVSQ